MRPTIFCICICLLLTGLSWAREDGSRKTLRDSEGITHGLLDISDRSYNTIDVNKFGQYVSNMGQFYSSWNEMSPTAEWPLGSNHQQMYRMNLYIGVPGNAVSSRTYSTKEWDPVAGYHNPAIGLLAVSKDSTTWPLDNGGYPYWPVQDQDGNALIVSHQDSYGAYRDRTNYLARSDPSKRLNIEVRQTTYAWNTALDEDYIIIKFDVINDTTASKDSVFFCMFCDFDIGGFESAEEYADDKVALELDRQFFYFYDVDNWSDQWNGLPFHMGMVFLQTPLVNGARLGLTDWHYTDVWLEPGRDVNNDDAQYKYMSSDPRLRADSLVWRDLFHGDNLKYDDPSLIPEAGLAAVVFASSGPYHMEAGDTLTFITALVAGADYDDLSKNVDRIWEVYNNNWQIKSVPAPLVTGIAGDGKNTLIWNNSIDRSYIEPTTGTNTLKGYNIYRTEDPNRLTWNLYDFLPRGFSPGDAPVEEAYTYVDDDV
ncbi:hypothetical protein JXO59_08385, partial [candidate division KSB1 bacterium]|nr:hypothetical protein [candidate division KSB1 bacterium]